ncbi:hypothetical protein PybrP1_001909 [[Pythium] brassicae (nom. inval.)]|nr:hypothetical protein PybrP1_001909 [[Pythium] brassicae (nom. inval.)]
MAAAPTSDTSAAPASTPASSKKQKRSGDKATPSGSAKKARTTAPVKPQSNTLYSWFKKTAAPKADEPAAESSSANDAALTAADSDATPKSSSTNGSSSNGELVAASADVSPERKNVTPPVEKKKKVVDAGTSSVKKLVQRRIHINDPCRVCDNARTEDTSRCELRCLGCDMTVHKKCYGVESEDPIDDWNCRRCQFILDRKKELEDAKGEEDVVAEAAETDAHPAENASLLPPVHEPLESSHKYHALHGDSDFATVFQFLKRFRRMGLKISMDATITNLADALVEPTASKFMEELHLRLLLNVEATVSKNHDWTVSLARFLSDSTLATQSPSLGAFIKSGAPALSSGKKEPSAVPTAALYAALGASERVAVLKLLCEAQFDDNDTLIERIGDQEGDSLRDEPAGTDSKGRTYWAIEDAPSVLEGTVWVCRSGAFSNALESSAWETVSDDLASLQSLVAWLSLSCETADLQLWQRFASGVLKSLERRCKKQQQSAMRLARMPHLLGGVPGLGSLVDDDGFGVRRSTRNRRAVSYRVESEDEAEEEEDGAGDDDGEDEQEEGDASHASDDGDDGDDNEDEEGDDSGAGSDDHRPSKRPRRSQQTKHRKPEAAPSRRSARLRGGDGSRSAASAASSSSPSPPRRRSLSSRRLRRSRRSRSSGSDDDGSNSDKSDKSDSSSEEDDQHAAEASSSGEEE